MQIPTTSLPNASFAYVPVCERVLAENDELGVATACLPQGYDGPCLVRVVGRTRRTLGFPTVDQAEAAARFAVGSLGGYYRAVVEQGTAADVTHQDWKDWAFE